MYSNAQKNCISKCNFFIIIIYISPLLVLLLGKHQHMFHMIYKYLHLYNILYLLEIYNQLDLKEKGYIMLTMHRPANVDEAEKLKRTMKEIVGNVHGLPVIFPIHPRTAKIFKDLGIEADNLHIVDPMGYLEFNYMVKHSKAVITDSGGITEEPR